MKRLSLALLIAFSCVVTANADDINYGDFDADTVTYIDVTESSNDPTPLYGTPEVFGNQLDLPGTGFISETNNGEVDFLDGRLTFMIEADPGSTISSITIEEFGAYFTFGEDSIARVSAIAFVETLEGDIVSGTFDQQFDGSPSGPDGGEWFQSLTINFEATSKITVTLDNQLFTFADEPGVAFIDKKGVDINVGKNVVPEPTSAALLGLSMMGIALRSRRRV